MKTATRSQVTHKTATVLAVKSAPRVKVLATGRSISEAMARASAGAKAKTEPAILFVPRRDAIHIF